MSLYRFYLFIFVVVFASISSVAVGQMSKTTGTIQGMVVDQTGGAVPGAHVSLSNSETNQQRSSTTDSTGSFLFSSVPAGLYRLSVEAIGFSRYQNEAIESNLGRNSFVMPHLLPAKVQQQVTVSGEGPPLDVTQTTVATTVGHERIEESPVVTRNYLNFV